MEFNLDSK